MTRRGALSPPPARTAARKIPGPADTTTNRPWGFAGRSRIPGGHALPQGGRIMFEQVRLPSTHRPHSHPTTESGSRPVAGWWCTPRNRRAWRRRPSPGGGMPACADGGAARWEGPQVQAGYGRLLSSGLVAVRSLASEALDATPGPGEYYSDNY